MAHNDTALLFRAMAARFREVSDAFEGKTEADLILPAPVGAGALMRYAESEGKLPPHDKRAFDLHRIALVARCSGDQRLVMRWLPEACEELATRAENGAPHMEAPLELLKRLPQ